MEMKDAGASPGIRDNHMHKLLTTSAVIASLAALGTIAAPTGAEAQYYGGYQRTYPTYRAYPAPSYRPFFYTPPSYRGGGYYDYRRYGYPGSRDALDTCAYC